MELVKFRITKKKEMYVNPEKVTSVVSYGENKTMIHFVNSFTTAIVLHNTEYVVAKLTGKSELDL